MQRNRQHWAHKDKDKRIQKLKIHISMNKKTKTKQNKNKKKQQQNCGWNKVRGKGKLLLFRIKHTMCYSCSQVDERHIHDRRKRKQSTLYHRKDSLSFEIWMFCTVMLSQWLWIMVCYTEPVVVNHGVLYWTSGCESGFIIQSKWLWIMLCYSEPRVVNHSELWWASGCESCCVILSQAGIVNHI